MKNINFPELSDWNEEVHDRASDQNVRATTEAAHRLVVSIANLRSSVSSQLGYLQNKIGHLNESSDQLNKSLAQLNENIKNAEKSSTDLAKALNKLTFLGVGAAILGVAVTTIQFLFENKIWPFPS